MRGCLSSGAYRAVHNAFPISVALLLGVPSAAKMTIQREIDVRASIPSITCLQEATGRPDSSLPSLCACVSLAPCAFRSSPTSIPYQDFETCPPKPFPHPQGSERKSSQRAPPSLRSFCAPIIVRIVALMLRYHLPPVHPLSWDSVYEREVTTFKDIGDEGEVWCADARASASQESRC